MFKCNICEKQFKSYSALSGHKRMHGPSGGALPEQFISKVCSIDTKEEVIAKFFPEYLNQLTPCKQCGKLFKFGNGKIAFCSRSCSASFNNKLLIRTEESKRKTSESLKNRFADKPKKEVYSYSKICINSCHHCNSKWVSRIRRKYCDECKEKYSESAKQGYKFTFNVFHFPDLFDTTELQKVGFYGPKGKSGRYNIDGISRDHKVSVNEAIRNNYDPFYVTHPLNCELMTHKENNKKKTKSSITYDELKVLVNSYESILK